jgi:hypothetical protein
MRARAEKDRGDHFRRLGGVFRSFTDACADGRAKAVDPGRRRL